MKPYHAKGAWRVLTKNGLELFDSQQSAIEFAENACSDCERYPCECDSCPTCENYQCVCEEWNVQEETSY